MSFQAVGPEEPKERSPKLAVQDRGTSSLFASAEVTEDGQEQRSVMCAEARQAVGCQTIQTLVCQQT